MARTTGLILASAILIIFAVIVMIFVVRTPRAATGTTLPISTEPAPDIKQLPSGAQPAGVGSLSRGGRFFARITAREDSTRLVGELSGDKYEPLENQRIKLEKPEGWAFLKSGRTVHMRADTGLAYMPDQGQGARPRDAVLEGNVVIKVFDPLPEGKRPRLDIDEPFAIIKTSILKFDGELGQVQLPEHVDATSAAGEFHGKGVTVLFNDVDQRLELVYVIQTDKLLFNPAYKAPAPAQPSPSNVVAAPHPPAPAPAPPNSPAPAVVTTAAPAPAPTPGVETLYHMTCSDKVVVAQAGRRIESDKLDGWARLEGNSLRPGAIATSNSPTQKTPHKKPASNHTAPPAHPTAVPTPSKPTEPAEPKPAAPATDVPADATSPTLVAIDDSAPITMTWSGPMEVRPLTSAPGELSLNDVFVRFSSEKDGGATFSDEKTKALATGSLLEYGATRRDFALAAHEPMGASITLPGSGHALGQRFEMSLASGMIHIPTQGTIIAEKSGALPIPAFSDTKPGPDDALLPRSLSWSNQADFQLVMSPDKEVTPVLAEVHASGDAKATDGKGSLSGESLIAKFKPVTAKTSRLDHLEVAGQATGEDGRGGKLTSDTLEVTFIPTPDKPDQSDPSVITAQGGVHAERKDLTLASSFLEAHITRDDSNALVVTRLDARQSVTFDNADGVHAKAEDLHADPIANTAHLTGPPMSVQIAKQGTTITGQDMTLWNIERKLDSKGPGTLVHDGPLADLSLDKDKAPDAQASHAQAAHVQAEWSSGMTFDDIAGEATCLGDVQATVTKPPETKASGEPTGLERDEVNAEEVHLTFTPTPANDDLKAAADTSAGPPAPKPERKLLKIRAVGVPGNDDKPARVESRRYAVALPDPPKDDVPVAERILYLRGAQINVDNDKGTLDVPNPGKLLVLDRRAAAEEAQPKPDKPNANPDANAFPFETAGARGTSLFTWMGAMSMDRAIGVVHMNDHVHVGTIKDGQADKTELECDTLTARIREQSDPGAPKPTADSLSGELVSADAEGSVWLRSGTHEVSAKTLHYDAANKLATATAPDGDLVIINDRKALTQLTAREIKWDLAKDRIDITRPGTLVAPADTKKSTPSPSKK